MLEAAAIARRLALAHDVAAISKITQLGKIESAFRAIAFDSNVRLHTERLTQLPPSAGDIDLMDVADAVRAIVHIATALTRTGRSVSVDAHAS